MGGVRLSGRRRWKLVLFAVVLAVAGMAAGCARTATPRGDVTPQGGTSPQGNVAPQEGTAPQGNVTSQGGAAAEEGITVEGAWARPAEKGMNSAVYFTVRNAGKEDDRLIGASTDVAAEASLHETVAEGSAAAPGLVLVSHEGATEAGDMAGMEHDHQDGGSAGAAAKDGGPGDAGAGMQMQMPPGGMMRMRPVDAVPVPAGGTIEFKPGGLHVMLQDLKRDLKAGETFSLTLKFEKAGTRSVEVAVRQP